MVNIRAYLRGIIYVQDKKHIYAKRGKKGYNDMQI